jgi:putative oxidoreductase
MSSFAQSFNLTDPFNILRLICGLFFIPHLYAKFFEPAALGFFVTARFKPPAFWMYVAGAIEVVLTIGLIFAIYLPYVAAIAAFHLLVAAAGVYRTSGGKWLWNIGGIEYPVFWAICCAAVAIHAFS